MKPEALPQGLACAALAALSEGVAIKDHKRRYVWANDAFCQFADSNIGEIVGKTDDELFPEGPFIPEPRIDQAVLTDGRSNVRYETIVDRKGVFHEIAFSTNRATTEDGHWLINILHDVTELSAANHSLIAVSEQLAATSVELRAQALHDPLTGILNRRGFEQAAPTVLAGSPSAGALLMLDVDNFKQINDNYGHPAGDAALKVIATTMQDATRRERDVIGRLGGDEFMIALPGAQRADAEIVATRIQALLALRPIVSPLGNTVVATVSVGMAWGVPGPNPQLEDWQHLADQALRSAKRNGKNQVALRSVSSA